MTISFEIPREIERELSESVADLNAEEPVEPTWRSVDLARDSLGLSHGVPPIADSCCCNSSGVSLRNSQKLRSGTFNPSNPYGV